MVLTRILMVRTNVHFFWSTALEEQDKDINENDMLAHACYVLGFRDRRLKAQIKFWRMPILEQAQKSMTKYLHWQTLSTTSAISTLIMIMTSQLYYLILIVNYKSSHDLSLMRFGSPLNPNGAPIN